MNSNSNDDQRKRDIAAMRAAAKAAAEAYAARAATSAMRTAESDAMLTAFFALAQPGKGRDENDNSNNLDS